MRYGIISKICQDISPLLHHKLYVIIIPNVAEELRIEAKLCKIDNSHL